MNAKKLKISMCEWNSSNGWHSIIGMIWFTISDRLFSRFNRLFDCSLNYERSFFFCSSFFISSAISSRLIPFHYISINWFTALNSYHSILPNHSALPSTSCAWDINTFQWIEFMRVSFSCCVCVVIVLSVCSISLVPQ